MSSKVLVAGDPIPLPCEIVEVRVRDLRQMFNAIDPSPFHERDLDPKAEEFIESWASGVPGSARIALLVHLDGPPSPEDEAGVLRTAVHEHFRRKAEASRRRLRELFGRGRVSLAIGLVCLAATSVIANALAAATNGGGFSRVFQESLIIGGWVAMWRPMEVFLYDWWPILAEARRYDRLATMPVRMQYAAVAARPPGSTT